MARAVLSAAVTVMCGDAGRLKWLTIQVILPQKSTPKYSASPDEVTGGLGPLPPPVKEATKIGQTQGPTAGNRAFQVADRP